MTSFERLWSQPGESIVLDDLLEFVAEAGALNALAESMLVEFKEDRHALNIAEAVGALANTDGGIVFVGIADAGASPSERLRGISRSKVSSLIDHLQQVMRDAMPEVIEISLGSDDRFVVLLRVHPERVVLPVVVDGRVMLRFPGSSVAARREDIEALIARRSNGDEADRLLPGTPIADPRRATLWSEGDEPAFEARTYTSGFLPPSAVDRLWLGTESKHRSRDTLDHGPVPNELLQFWPGHHEGPGQVWELGKATSTWFDVLAGWSSAPSVDRRPPMAAVARVHLDGRRLGILQSLGLRPSDRWPLTTLALEDLHELVLATVLSASETLSAVAATMAPMPLTHRRIVAWLVSPSMQQFLVSGVGPYARSPAVIDMGRVWLREVPVRETSFDEHDLIVRTWLTLLLLDNGASDFESAIEQLPRPRWAD